MRTKRKPQRLLANRNVSPHASRLGLEHLEVRSLLSASSLSADVPIGPPIDPTQLTNVNTSVDNQTSSVAIAPNGDFVVTWDNDNTTSGGSVNETVYARPYFADGQPKSAAVEVATNAPPTLSPKYTANPRVSMAGDGSFIVAWNVWHDTSPNQVAFRRFAADGSAKDASPVLADSSESQAGYSQDQVDVAAFADGGFVLAWTRYNSAEVILAVELRRFQADGTPLATNQFGIGYYSDNPRVAANQNTGQASGFVLTWEDPGPSATQVFAKTYHEDGTQIGTVAVTPARENDGESTVSMNDNGDFAVAWQHTIAQDQNQVFAQRFSLNGTSLDSVPVNPTDRVFPSGTPTGNLHPVVALADDQSMVVTWDDSLDGRPWYTPYPSPQGQGRILGGQIDAGYDSGFASDAVAGQTALAMTGSGRFVVSWQQDPNGGFPGINQVEVRKFHADLRPVAQDDTYVVSDSASSSVSTADNLLANDSDPFGQPSQLQAARVTDPAMGTISNWHEAGPLNGTFTYTPGPNFKGIDRFTYQDYDLDSNGPGNTVTVTLLSYHASLVDKLYHQVLHRSAEDSGLIYWTGQLDAGQPLDVVATGIFNSTERLNPLVAQFYQQYLGRATDPSGLAYWVADWQTKGDPRDVVENILASQEFFNDAGATNSGYINLLYQRVLQRPSEQSGLNYWLGLMSPPSNETRLQIASQFYDTHEKHVDLVDFLFGEYFQGVTPLPDATPYVTDLDQGQTETQVEKAIIDSTAYSTNPPKPAAGAVGQALYPH